MKFKLPVIIGLFSFIFSQNYAVASEKIDWPTIWQQYPYYLGVMLGWGCTDWSQLVARGTESEIGTLALSAPISAGDTGFVYGATLGAEISPHFALEANYMRFPNTPIKFEEYTLYSDNSINMNSNTYAYNIVGKFMVQVGHTGLRGYANAGPAFTHRQDLLVDAGHICPTFGVGLDYVVAKRLLTELAFQYYAGYGKAVLKPALNYMPFLYTIYFKFGFRF